MTKLLVLHGPNLNLLGTREPETYGSSTLEDIDRRLEKVAQELGVSLQCKQRNSESDLVELVHQASRDGVAFIVINPAAYTHTSVAIRDALAGVAIPFIEVHLSNVHAREEFRQVSYFSDIAVGVISGLGPAGYESALRCAVELLNKRS
ncbi:MAG: type II 3-dehydroquinate dehydratase [Gammaproteobacteria bacterium]|nr:type II 3-dehydroquinate dehydratase [Gammaproteobacteria bacterium]